MKKKKKVGGLRFLNFKTYGKFENYQNGTKEVLEFIKDIDGYKVVVLPFNSLTQEERNRHALPDVYILLADTYGIRQINITGEVF